MYPPTQSDSFSSSHPSTLLAQAELSAYNGTDETKPLLLALSGVVFDVSLGRDFYGPGGPYAAFAGHECGRALATMSLNAADLDRADLEGVADPEKAAKILQQWADKFREKYPVVGQLVG